MRRRLDLIGQFKRLMGVMLACTLMASVMLGLPGCEPESGLPKVQLGDTVITGVNEANGIAAFLGLPFAEPPVERRWARPVPGGPMANRSTRPLSHRPACKRIVASSGTAA